MKTMHFITRSDGQGSHSAGTYCGKDPDNDIAFVEKDVTCVECMKGAIIYLRDALNRSCEIDEEWLNNVRAYKQIIKEAKQILDGIHGAVRSVRGENCTNEMSIGIFTRCPDCFYEDAERVGWCQRCLRFEIDDARHLERQCSASRIRKLKEKERNSILKRTLDAAVDAVLSEEEPEESFTYGVSRA